MAYESAKRAGLLVRSTGELLISAPIADELEIAGQGGFMVQLEPLLPEAYRLATVMLGSERDAEDAVQEAALKAWRSRRRFRPGSKFRPWFLTIVANQCRSQRRLKWLSVIKGAERDGPALVGGLDLVDSMALRSAVAELDYATRLILALRFYLDLDYTEVGEAVGISEAAAKSRVHRAVSKLKRRLPQEVGQ